MPIGWEDAVSAKRADRDALINSHRATKNAMDNDIQVTQIDDIEALQELLKTRRTSAEKTILAYIQRCDFFVPRYGDRF